MSRHVRVRPASMMRGRQSVVVLPQEAARGWDGDDEDEDSEEGAEDDWVWGQYIKTGKGHRAQDPGNSESDEGAEEKEEGEEEDLAPEGGWGWVVTLASFVLYTLASMFANCFGVLFSGFLMDLGTSGTKVSEIFNVAFALSSFFSFLVGPLVEEYGWRNVSLVAGLVYGLGLAWSAFATSASFLFLSTVMLAGLTILVLEIIAQHSVSLYFTRRRRFATCIVTSGTCASQVLLPPLITFLQEEYSSRGATLISAGIALNCCVAAMFLHPVEWHRKQRHSGLAENNKIPQPASPKRASSVLGSLRKVAEGTLRNLTYLKSPKIVIISLVLACNVSSLVNIWAVVPFALKTDGYSPQDVALCLSIAGMCNLASRLTNGILSCCAVFTIQKMYMIGSTMSAAGIIGFCLVDGLLWKIVLFGLCGLGNGTVSSLYTLVVVEVVGLQMQLPVLSLAGLITGIWFLFVDPLTGLVQDLSGSYAVSLSVLGGLLLSSVALWVCMPTARTHHRRRHHQEKQKEGYESRPLVRPSKPVSRTPAA